MERCPNCGASIRTGARFCTACGYRLIQPDAPTPAVSFADVPAERAPQTESPPRVQWNEAAPATASSGDDQSPVPGDDFPASSDSDDPTSDAASPMAEVDPAQPVAAESESGGGQESPVSDATSDAPESQGTSAPAGSRTDEHPSDGAETASGDSDGAIVLAESTDDQLPTDVDSDDPTEVGLSAERDDASSPDAVAPLDVSGEASDAEPASSAAGARDQTSAGWPDALSAGEESSFQDDVVIGSTVVRESSWPAGQDEGAAEVSADDLSGVAAVPDDASIPTLAEQAFEEDLSGDPATAAADVAGAEPAEAAEAGADVEWEPWGTSADGISSGDLAQTGQSGATPTGAGGDHQSRAERPDAQAGLDRARQLLDELHTALASVTLPAEPAIETEAATAAIDRIDQVEQLLVTYAGSPIEADRLTELQRLAEDLDGRDYDIRALQRFSQERQLIVELADAFQQQRDLIAQIGAVLNQGS